MCDVKIINDLINHDYLLRRRENLNCLPFSMRVIPFCLFLHIVHKFIVRHKRRRKIITIVMLFVLILSTAARCVLCYQLGVMVTVVTMTIKTKIKSKQLKLIWVDLRVALSSAEQLNKTTEKTLKFL